jgi:hypothetical protein
MPQLIPVQTVIVHRDGKSFAPEIGKAFNFTEAEVSELKKFAPKSVREPVNEAPVEAAAPAKGKASGKTDDGL